MNNTVRMNNGAMVLNYTDATSILQYTLERYTKFPHHPIGPIWFHYGGQWPILISCILRSFISFVKAYMLGLSIFFHSLMKFFIDGRKWIIFFNNAKFIMPMIWISVHCSLSSTSKLRKHKISTKSLVFVELRSFK